MSAVPVEHESAVSHPPNPVVMKFGGTSVESAGAIQQLVELVKARLRSHPVVIVSALAGVTDELLEAGKFSER